MAKKIVKQLIVCVPGLGNCVVVAPPPATDAKQLVRLMKAIKSQSPPTWLSCQSDAGPFDVRVSAIVGVWIYRETS